MKLKNTLINFAVKNRNVILKIFPIKFINFCQDKIVKSNNNFKRTTVIDENYDLGINFVGYIKAQFGLGQGSRLICKALLDSKYKTNIIDTNLGPSIKYGDHEFDKYLTNKFNYNINLFHVLPHATFEIMLSQISQSNLNGKYNIGYWLFELEDIPKKWEESFKYVNEIWTPSEFVTNAFKKVSPVPVYTIPYGIETKINNKIDRNHFNIPKDKFAFLIMFDSSSSSSRKNPDAAINAFVKAFKNNDDVCLVLKINNASENDILHLKERLKEIKYYVFIDKVLPKDDVYSLISLCDVFVSLHRSEGFGLVMAEAMNLGTVCIATNYSANIDFMNKDNSCLVDYKLIEVENELKTTNCLYVKGNKWADANVEQASEYMLKLYSDKDYYNKLKDNAQKYIKTKFSMSESTKKIEKRIKEIIKENNL